MEKLVLIVVIFIAAGFTLLFAGLVAGRLLRPHKPSPEKGEVYECGEQPIGTAWVQFDLRFYVVALLFVIFDVELAFFFPWAVVFGSATRAADESQPAEVRAAAAKAIQPPPPVWATTTGTVGRTLTAEELEKTKEKSKRDSTRPPPPAAAKSLAWIAFADILVFFGVLLVGFAYLWRRGDLKWVRSTAAQDKSSPGTAVPGRAEVHGGNA